jgi:hypothetical protein
MKIIPCSPVQFLPSTDVPLVMGNDLIYNRCFATNRFNDRSMKVIARICLYCSIGLFLASLSQPAFSVDQGWEENGTRIATWDALLCLLIGWLGFFEGGVGVTWLANPLLAMAWITFMLPGSSKVSFLFSIFAVVASASFLLFTQIIITEAGQRGTICHYHLGYWFWLSSTIVMLAGNGTRMLLLYSQQKQPSDNSPVA